MPAPDPRTGTTFIWIISLVLFLCITAGGGCLIAYMVLPSSSLQSRSWLPIVGVTLVCLPWVFWVFTCVYRIVSRCGFRARVGADHGVGGVEGGGGGGGGGGSIGGGSIVGNYTAGGASVRAAAEPPLRETYEITTDAMRAEFEAILELDEQDDHGEQEEKDKIRNDLSFRSHESEIPLASSMAS